MPDRHDDISAEPNQPHDPAELADLYAAGALSPAEAAEFEQRVAAGDPAFVAEHRRILPVLQMLLASAPEVAPPAQIRAAFLHDLGGDSDLASGAPPFRDYDPSDHAHADEPRTTAGVATGIAISRLSRARLYPTGIRGVRFRQLHASRRDNRRTIFLQMDPGTALPDHDHTGTEEVIMLTGDLRIAGTTLGPGDHIRITPGASHGIPRTTGGCTCIVISGYQPFPLSSWWGLIKATVAGLFRRQP